MAVPDLDEIPDQVGDDGVGGSGRVAAHPYPRPKVATTATGAARVLSLPSPLRQRTAAQARRRQKRAGRARSRERGPQQRLKHQDRSQRSNDRRLTPSNRRNESPGRGRSLLSSSCLSELPQHRLVWNPWSAPTPKSTIAQGETNASESRVRRHAPPPATEGRNDSHGRSRVLSLP